MAFTASVAKMNNATPSSVSVIPTGRVKWCFGVLTFAGADTYVTGGVDISQTVRKLFGVTDIIAIVFYGTSSDGSGAGTNSHMLPRYIFTPQMTVPAQSQSAVVKLFQVGRTVTSTVNASEVEVANGDSINNLILTFMAICRGEGATYDQKGN